MTEYYDCLFHLSMLCSVFVLGVWVSAPKAGWCFRYSTMNLLQGRHTGYSSRIEYANAISGDKYIHKFALIDAVFLIVQCCNEWASIVALIPISSSFRAAASLKVGGSRGTQSLHMCSCPPHSRMFGANHPFWRGWGRDCRLRSAFCCMS